MSSNPRRVAIASGSDDELSPAARAFIAAERARGPEQQLSVDPAVRAAHSATRLAPSKPKSDRSMILAYVLWYFGGPLAAHRFYLGAYRSAWTMVGLFWGGLLIGGLMSKKSTLSIGGYFLPPPGIAMILICGIWLFIDMFLIPGLLRRYRAARQTADLERVFA